MKQGQTLLNPTTHACADRANIFLPRGRERGEGRDYLGVGEGVRQVGDEDGGRRVGAGSSVFGSLVLPHLLLLLLRCRNRETSTEVWQRARV